MTQHVIAQLACMKMQMEFVKIVIQNVKHAKNQPLIVNLVKKTESMLTQLNVYAQLEPTMMEMSPVQHVLIDVQLVILVMFVLLVPKEEHYQPIHLVIVNPENTKFVEHLTVSLVMENVNNPLVDLVIILVMNVLIHQPAVPNVLVTEFKILIPDHVIVLMDTITTEEQHAHHVIINVQLVTKMQMIV
jgi:hypothetical protein